MKIDFAIAIAAVLLIGALAFNAGERVGYHDGRCETFDAFVVASGFPIDNPNAYRPRECR